MARRLGAVKRRKLSGRKVLGIALLAFGVVVLVCVVVLLSFPGPFLQRFVEGRITEGFAASYPGYSMRITGLRFEIMKNRIACDSVTLTRNDSSFSCSMATLSVSGIHWLGLLRGTGSDPGSLAGSVVEAGEVDMALQRSGYGLRCGPLRVSVPDSEIMADALQIHPLMKDEEFFGGSRSRKTRFGIGGHQCRLGGLAFVDLLRGQTLHARSITIQDVSIDVLINKDKPFDVDSPHPRMPNEILASTKDTLGIDSLIIIGGSLRYSERFVMGWKPARLTFDGLEVVMTGIASHAGPNADAVVQARGIFMGAGTMNLAMSIPLSRQQFSFRFSGSLSGMDLSKLNPWVEPSDQTRIKTGMLKWAAFDINVNAGSATGNVRAIYENLVVASINSRTGSESGIMDRFSSWIAKNVKIRSTNTPDRSGKMKMGTVKYARQKDDPFFGFAWFALRSGVGDLVGF